MLDNAFVYYYDKGKNEVYNLIESKGHPWPLWSLFLGLNKMAIKICQFLTTLTTLTLIILFLEMLKFSKLIKYSIDMCQSYQGITIVKFLYNGWTNPHPQK
jgi:hypothetical protein